MNAPFEEWLGAVETEYRDPKDRSSPTYIWPVTRVSGRQVHLEARVRGRFEDEPPGYFLFVNVSGLPQSSTFDGQFFEAETLPTVDSTLAKALPILEAALLEIGISAPPKRGGGDSDSPEIAG